MKKNYTIVTSIIIVLLFVGTIIGIFVFYKVPRGQEEFDYLKDYQDNEYMPVYISEEKMAKLYYSDFLTIVKTDLQSAYDLMNYEYKKKRFPSFGSFQSFIGVYNNLTPESYSIVRKDDKEIFYIRLTDGNEIIFVTTGVMIYEVYFDDDTIPIE